MTHALWNWHPLSWAGRGVFSRSVVSDSATPWTAAPQASLFHYLLKFAETHVH